MKLLAVLSLFALAVTATPASSSNSAPCLSSSDAKKIISRWTSAFVGDVSMVKKVAAPGIKVYDNSINFLFGLPRDSPYIDGIESFEKASNFSATSEKNAKFEVVYALNDCKSISFRWKYKGETTKAGDDDCGKPSSTPVGATISYSGIDIMIVDPKTLKVTKAWSAFDGLDLTFQSGGRVCYKKGANGLPDPSACTCPGTCPNPASSNELAGSK